MTCPRCHAENRERLRFCEDCGSRLTLTCAQCGGELAPGKRFCGSCGAPSAGQSTARPPSPESYTPKHLAEKILTSKSALEGERKQVTVLFADLKGSMELLADRDPEEARKLLDPILERMMEAVHHYEGTVNQVMGDGIMALFGAPIGHEDHAVRACYAALRMQRRVNLYADEIQRGGGTPVQIRVGLNSGEVVVRAIGSDLHMDYTAVGQTTHLAARMEQMAKPGSALVTGDTLKLAEGYVQVKPLGAVAVKGLATPTPVYELTATVATRSRLQASATRGLTRFVGRDGELQQLAQALERAATGHGQAVAVVGEAGVGKSRLAWEFTRSHRTQGWLVLESGSVSYGKTIPYLPVIELLKGYCRIQERDEPREIRERVAGKLLMLDRALEPLLTPLLALLDVPVEDAAWTALDPPQRRQRTLDAIKRLLLRESLVQPLLLLFEDLHWIDAETQALLDGLMESLPTARLLLLVNYRPEYQHAWGGKTYYLQLRIDPLLPESADTLLTALLGEDGTLEPLKRVLIERTEGNPFFLEESVRTLVETQVLVGERGAYRVAKTPDTWQIPVTVQAILAARIDRLAPEDKRLLQAAAVIGKDVPFMLLQAIADVPEDNLRRALPHLQAAEFLYETSLFPDLEYTFKHALTHEVAYGSLLQERRRAQHARIVEAIERLYPDRLAEHIEPLAYHAVRGEAWEKAVTYLRQAGVKAAGRSAFRQAAAAYEEALGLLPRLPESRFALEHAVDLRTDLRDVLTPLGESQRLLPELLAAVPIAERLQDRWRQVHVASGLVNTLIGLSDYRRSVTEGIRALALADGLEDAVLRAQLGYRLGASYHMLGDFPRAIAILRDGVTLSAGEHLYARPGAATLPSVMARVWLALSQAETGSFAESLAMADEAMQIATAADHPFSLSFACWALGLVSLRRGDLDRATSALAQGWEIGRVWGIVSLFLTCGAALGYARALLGHHAEARRLIDEAEASRASRALPWGQSLRDGWYAEAHLLADRVDEARGLAQDALRLAEAHEEIGCRAWVLRLLGDIAARGGPPGVEEAGAHFRQALTLAGSLGMRPLVAHCYLGLGTLYRQTGDAAKAEEQLTTAATMYREMGMTFWLEKAGRLRG